MMGIGISGTGRIGRLLIRSLIDRAEIAEQLKAINSIYPAETVAHLLKYDSVHGTWKADVSAEDGKLRINGRLIPCVSHRNPKDIPWKKLGVQLVMDATGKFNDREGASRHIAAGASRVILTAPGKEMDLTIVMGVNDRQFDPARHRILSAASCTTNCVAPVLKILDDSFQVKSGWMTTVHAVTSDQNLLDNPHKDLRRARACTQSIIPTSTGVRKALADVLPHLAPHVEGLSLRVPTQDVSLVDLTVQVGRSASAADVKEAFKLAAAHTFAGYVAYSEEPLVSADYIGNAHSAIIDGLSIMQQGQHIKVLAWYDNEWAYACRVVELAAMVARQATGSESADNRVPALAIPDGISY
ncbi:type I glyceraldehyde-3-phosphate dehydrogenase [Paenibacillus sp. J5C_2022]|nr:type I glyceraldehyde-3-phosphate dehydrogenase [Paenibacillus sp. J5C2022]MCU6708677.1 type I glyceraldehyde-3-phosphate dehydrogenase [Paenibacillus sp. J5C2022]